MRYMVIGIVLSVVGVLSLVTSKHVIGSAKNQANKCDNYNYELLGELSNCHEMKEMCMEFVRKTKENK